MANLDFTISFSELASEWVVLGGSDWITLSDTHDPRRDVHWIETRDDVTRTGVSSRCVYGYWRERSAI